MATPQANLNTLQKHRNITLERVGKFSEKFGSTSEFHLNYEDLWKVKTVDPVLHGDEAYPCSPFEEAVKAEYRPTRLGEWFGPSWSTHWFKVTVVIPNDENVIGEEVILNFDPDCEGMFWSVDGKPLGGITGGWGRERRIDIVLTTSAVAEETIELYVEIACNAFAGNGPNRETGHDAPNPNRYFRLSAAEMCVKNMDAFHLYYDYEVLLGIIRELPAESQLNADALHTANQIVNTYRRGDSSSIPKCREISSSFLKLRVRDQMPTSHEITAIGHCHLDTAFLWPYSETKRKAARSWASQLSLMEDYPFYKFTASSAQQFAWVEEDYPELFKRIQDKSESGQLFRWGERGLRWIAIFLQGKAYAATNDTSSRGLVLVPLFSGFQSLMLFGNGDGGGGPLPQMIETLDRARNVDGLGATLKFGSPVDFFKRLESSSKDLVTWKGELYLEYHRGTADIKKYNRQLEFLLRDVELLSTLAMNVKASKPYKNPKAELDDMWKKLLLNQFHDVLPGSSIEMVYDDAKLYYRKIRSNGIRLREEALDVLEGATSIRSAEPGVLAINTTSWARPAHVKEMSLIDLDLLDVSYLQKDAKGEKGLLLVNEIPPMSINVVNTDCMAANVPHVSAKEVFEEVDEINDDGFVEGRLFPSQFSLIKVVEPSKQRRIILLNNFVKVVLDTNGRIISLFDNVESRELIPEGHVANSFKLFDDVCGYWDAWDVEVYHLEKGWDAKLGDAKIVEFGPLRVVVLAKHPITSKSWIEQKIILTPFSPVITFETKVNWHENRTQLKVEFPVNIKSDFATYETQFGVTKRPTHYNTSWDLAKFEVCGHKFVDLSEHQYGVSLISERFANLATFGTKTRASKFGIAQNTHNGRSDVVKAPDANTDMGEHLIRFSLYPHTGSFVTSDVVQTAYQFNVPTLIRPIPRTHKTAVASLSQSEKFFSLNCANVVLDTVKISEDPRPKSGGRDIVIRFYEAYGGRTDAIFSTALNIKTAHFCNILEDVGDVVPRDEEGNLLLTFKPFQIITVRILLS
ncbi:galactose mutarotase-like domain-containing protein [Chytridium lagenaria]|nr:galactose mutarotase-like domain-containing protein [Chytridium lagenaria]